MKTLLLTVSLTLIAGAAFAQDQAPPPQGHSAFLQACGNDIKQYCASAQSRDDRRACVKQNKDKFSPSCKTFMASHPMHQHAQGGGGH